MNRLRLLSALAAVALAAAVQPPAPRAQDVFSTTTGGGTTLQGGVSTDAPAAEPATGGGRTSRPTGTQGIEGNPNCPPPQLPGGGTPKNWSCPTRTQGIEGNPLCPPPVMQGGMVPRNWSCNGPDMQPDPLGPPLRDPTIVVDYRGDPALPPLMRGNPRNEQEVVTGAVLTCRRAVVEAIDRPSQAEMAEYVCTDQTRAVSELPPFQLYVEETGRCIQPLNGAVQELKAGKMLLMKARGAQCAERQQHATQGNGHLRRAAAGVRQADQCLVQNQPPPQPPQRPTRPPPRREPTVAETRHDPRRDPCKPVAGVDPRIRALTAANCPPPGQVAMQGPPAGVRPPQQGTPGNNPAPSENCQMPPPPPDIREQLMNWAREMDRIATENQKAARKAADRFFTGMSEVVQQQLVFLAQKPGEPAKQIAEAVVRYLNNDRNENHRQLLESAHKAVMEFYNDPAYSLGKATANAGMDKVSGFATQKLAAGATFCVAATKRAIQETQKIQQATKAAGTLKKMHADGKAAAEAANSCKAPEPSLEGCRFGSATGPLPENCANVPKPLSQQTTPANPFGQRKNCFPVAVANQLRKDNPTMPYTDSDILLLAADEMVDDITVQAVLKQRFGHKEFPHLTAQQRQWFEEGKPFPARNSGDIQVLLNRGGPNSRGLVFYKDKKTNTGHVVEVHLDNKDRRVIYTDSQTGVDARMYATTADLDPDGSALFFFPTN